MIKTIYMSKCPDHWCPNHGGTKLDKCKANICTGQIGYKTQHARHRKRDHIIGLSVEKKLKVIQFVVLQI